jgi:hypothetical protein
VEIVVAFALENVFNFKNISPQRFVGSPAFLAVQQGPLAEIA